MFQLLCSRFNLLVIIFNCRKNTPGTGRTERESGPAFWGPTERLQVPVYFIFIFNIYMQMVAESKCAGPCEWVSF